MKRVLGLLVCGLLALPAQADKVYKWVDAEGNTQYTQTPPPPSVQTDTVHLPTDPPPLPAAADSTDAPPAAAGNAPDNKALQEQARARNCQIARQNLETMTTNSNIAMPDPNANNKLKVLNDEERLAAIEKAKQQVTEFCTIHAPTAAPPAPTTP